MSQNRRRCLVAMAATLLTPHLPAQDDERPAPSWQLVDDDELPASFLRIDATRPDGSTQTLFLDHLHPDRDEPMPLLVYVEGSGAQSLFHKFPNGTVGYGLFGLIAEHASDRMRVASIEKRGVPFGGGGGQRGTGEGASEEYHRHATLADRTHEVRLGLDALLEHPEIDADCVVLMGHSEGADVAAAVAGCDPRVTHVAFLSGGGPAQFYDFFLMRRDRMRADGASDEEIADAMHALEEEIADVLADPDSTEKTFMGHAYRRWSTFATTAAADSLVRTDASVFLAHGSADTSVPIQSFDYLVVRLLCSGHDDVTVRRLPGRNHSLDRPGQPPNGEGFLEVLDEVLDWVQ